MRQGETRESLSPEALERIRRDDEDAAEKLRREEEDRVDERARVAAELAEEKRNNRIGVAVLTLVAAMLAWQLRLTGDITPTVGGIAIGGAIVAGNLISRKTFGPITTKVLDKIPSIKGGGS